MCSFFKKASANFCHAVVGLAQLLASKVVSPVGVSPLLPSRLVVLDKQPGVHPIGVGMVLWRIVGNVILAVTKTDVEDACGHLQKCSGTPSGMEAAVHAMKAIYVEETTEGVLLVDAANAITSLNQAAALHNVKHVCPSLATDLANSYQTPARLFISGGGEMLSEMRTKQDDPLSSKKCNLCQAEKLAIIGADHSKPLNKRSELVSKCRHANKNYLSNFLPP